jgi:hypothetical protein
MNTPTQIKRLSALAVGITPLATLSATALATPIDKDQATLDQLLQDRKLPAFGDVMKGFAECAGPPKP